MENNYEKAITVLAEKLGTTAEYLWGVLIKQSQIEIYLCALSIIGFILYSIGYVYFVKWLTKNYKKMYENDADIPFTVLMIITGIGLILWLCVSMFDIKTIITVINNPEYWALQQILHKL